MEESPEPIGEIILYQTEDGKTRIECRFANRNPLDKPGIDGAAFPDHPAKRHHAHPNHL